MVQSVEGPAIHHTNIILSPFSSTGELKGVKLVGGGGLRREGGGKCTWVWFIIYVKTYNTISNTIGYRWAESGRVGTTWEG